MAPQFKLFFVLWVVAACLGEAQTSSPSTSSTPVSENSSIPPEATSTGPDGSSTPPEATSTGPDGSSTPPEATSTGPDGSSTLLPSEATPTGPDGSSTLLPSETTAGGSDGSSITSQPPTIPSDPCEVNQCGRGSTCEPRAHQGYVCLCLAGDFYNYISKSCENAKVFPGYLSLPGISYDELMEDHKSSKFLETSLKISCALIKVFENFTDYIESTVQELKPIENNKAWSRKDDTVNATVEIIFPATSDIKSSEVDEQINSYGKSCTDCLLSKASFSEESLCDVNACDKNTTKCLSGDGSFNCTCMANYVETDFSHRVCMACPSGKKAVDSKCVKCPFGYSGFNCNESWQLALVIVGTVLGALLLITSILLPIVACKSSKKSSKTSKNANIGKPYATHSLSKAPLVDKSLDNSQAAPVNGSANPFANIGVPRIPRATAKSSWDSKTNLEMTPSNSQQNLVPMGRNSRLYEDQDDMAPYAQTRPQINPYTHNQPQNNPYASNQGQTNPYYAHDNGRRLN